MKEQGYEFEINEVVQDKQLAMKIEKNGQNLCMGNSRHIDICYFLRKIELTKASLKLSIVQLT